MKTKKKKNDEMSDYRMEKVYNISALIILCRINIGKYKDIRNIIKGTVID